MEYSWPWPSTEDPGPQVGDGRKVTSTEFAYLLLKLFNAGVVPVDNELVVTSPGANQIEVDAGYAIVMGKWYGADAAVALAPDSAPAATTRKDSVILQCDWTGGGATEQYTVRAITKEGTAGAYPALTQTENTLWEDRLYNYTIDDAGAITGITDARTMAAFNTELKDDAVTAAKIAAAVAGNGLAGGGGAALSVNVDGSTIEINADTLRVKASGITANEIAAGAVGVSEIAAAVAGNGLAGGGGAELSVNVDGSTIEINADALRVKDSGITAAKIANRARRFLVPAPAGENETTSTILRPVFTGLLLDPDSFTSVYSNFCVPNDFVSGMTVKPIVRGSNNGDVRITQRAYYAGAGQDYFYHDTGLVSTTETLVLNDLDELTALSLASADTGDFVQLTFIRDGLNAADTNVGNVFLLGWLIEYTADS